MQNELRSEKLAAAMASISALVFDWNGTILNDAERARTATNRVLSEVALPALSVERFRESFQLPMTAFFHSLGVLKVDLEEAVSDWNRFLVGGHIELSSGVREMFDAAKSSEMPIFIVSAASADVVRADAMQMEVDQYLSVIVGDARVKSSALREISANAGGQVLYCGDTEYDIIEAKIAGAIAVGFGGGYRPASDLIKVDPLVVIDDFVEIVEALNRSQPARQLASGRQKVFPE